MKEKLSLVGVLIIIAGVAFATARLAWSSKAPQAQKQIPQQVSSEFEPVVQKASEEERKPQEIELEKPQANSEGSIAGEKVATSTSVEEEKRLETAQQETLVGLQETETGETIVASRDMQIEQPTYGAMLTSPFTVEGTTRLKEVQIHVTNKSGSVLIDEHAPVRFAQGQTWGTFRWQVTYEFSGTKEGYVVVLPEDDSAGGIKVPVTFN